MLICRADEIFYWILDSKIKIAAFMFCNIINVFTVTFDQINASLLNKSIHFFHTLLIRSVQHV